MAMASGIMRMLDRRELMGVLAHELRHVHNRDILVSAIAATLAGAMAPCWPSPPGDDVRQATAAAVDVAVQRHRRAIGSAGS